MCRLVPWLAVVAFWCLTSVVNATPIAFSRACFGWRNFAIETIDMSYGTPTIPWNTKEEVEASAYEGFQSDSASDWTTSLDVSTAWGGASASAAIDTQKMEVYADPEVGAH